MNEPYPKVSIIIPALNEQKYIRKCLDSVMALDYPKDKYEVIVVDNGSIDETLAIAKSYKIKVILKPGIKVGAVRNAGYKASVGEILAFTDADCVLPRQWLIDALRYLNQPDVGAVGGGCLVEKTATWLEKAWVSGQGADVLVAKYLPGANFIVSRDVFSACDGFDENIVAGEDDNLSLKIKGHGYQLLSIKQCYVIHLGYPKSLYHVIKRQVWHSKNSIDITNTLTDKLFIATNVFLFCNILLAFLVVNDETGIFIYFIILLILCIINIQPLKKVRALYKQNNDVMHCLVKLLQLNIIYYCYFVGRSIGLVVNYLHKTARLFHRQDA